MCRRAAHVETSDWCAILGPTWRRTQKEKLFESQFTLKYISFRESKIAFEVQRCQHLTVGDQVLDIWSVFGNCIYNRVAKLFALVVPVTLFQVVRRVLYNTEHHVLARRRHGRISQTGSDHVDIWTPREAPILRFVI